MRLIILIAFSIMWKYTFPQTDKYASARNDMVRYQISDRGIVNSEVLRAMRKIPRHLFVPAECQSDAYGDYPLPIGYGQTISQPYIVAYMTEVVKPDKKKKVLEIGTGSGYQAAILAEIADTIVTAAAAEIPKPLIDQLAENGRLVIPVGKPGELQDLILIIKKKGKIEKKQLSVVRFVPFRRL